MHYAGSAGKLQADLGAGAEIEIRGKIPEFFQAGRSYRDSRSEATKLICLKRTFPYKIASG